MQRSSSRSSKGEFVKIVYVSFALVVVALAAFLIHVIPSRPYYEGELENGGSDAFLTGILMGLPAVMIVWMPSRRCRRYGE